MVRVVCVCLDRSGQHFWVCVVKCVCCFSSVFAHVFVIVCECVCGFGVCMLKGLRVCECVKANVRAW